MKLNNDVLATPFKPPFPIAPKGSLLFIPGWQRSQTVHHDRAGQFARLGWFGLTLDLPGFGPDALDPVPFTPHQHSRAALDAYDWLTERSGHEPVIVTSSYGCVIALLVAEKRKPPGLVLRAPTLYQNREIHMRKAGRDANKNSGFRSRVHHPEESKLLASAHSFAGDALLIQSELDEVIPSTVIESYWLAFQSGKARSAVHLTMPQAPHSLNTPDLQSQFTDILGNWLNAL